VYAIVPFEPVHNVAGMLKVDVTALTTAIDADALVVHPFNTADNDIVDVPIVE
jgi:hypothetical protein